VQLHGYFDGELDALGAAAFEKHLATCTDCQRLLAAEKALRTSLQKAELSERAPSSLRNALRAAAPSKAPTVVPRLADAASFWWRSLALAAALLLAALLGWRQFSQPPAISTQMVASTLVDAHLRSLQPGHLTDVESTDRHTVKPWFDGRLDFAPPVQDLANQGFPLMGGRLDVVQGRSVAALVYGRRKHIINVFIAKAQPGTPWSGSGTEQGYHWLAWQDGEFSFFAVSDVTSADLDELRQLFVNK
jgi:anti-sigma factor RsiW